VSKITTLASGQITPSDALAVELVETDETPSAVIIRWPLKASVCQVATQPTVTDPAKLRRVLSLSCASWARRKLS
jgi:hypothetical protein